jgi:hypothetical protein
MKKVFVFISIMSFVACTAPEAVEKRVGFGGEAGKVGIGSQSSVDVVVGLDKAWKEYDLEAMRVFLADSAEFNMSDGKSVKSAQAFWISYMKRPERILLMLGICFMLLL